MSHIVAVDVDDVRFPTSRQFDGSDAMNPDPDYSAAYVTLRTDDPAVPAGHSLVFTIGRGNDVQCAAITALAGHVIGRSVDEIYSDLGGFARMLVGDSQLRWLGPEKGVMHMAVGAMINAAWDLAARRAEAPLWQFIGQMAPRQIVDLVDFRYITDALAPGEALDLLQRAEDGKNARTEHLRSRGYPAYTTSPGWLGYSDEKLVRLSKQAVADGFHAIKLKVGANLADDQRRLAFAREAVGPDIAIAVDANQRWDVGEAIDWMHGLESAKPAWVEEPTSPDDVLGHAAIRHGIAPIRVSTGEHGANRMLFKQLLQAGAVDLLQIDACRVGGVNDNIAILLMAAKFGVPVYPHAGGVGLCEMVQHLAMADYVAISGSMDDRAIEYVDHLHEHFVDPVQISRGRYRAPTAPGMSAKMHSTSIAEFQFPNGPAWVNAGMSTGGTSAERTHMDRSVGARR